MKRGPQRPPGRWGDEGGIGLICYVDRAEVPNLEDIDPAVLLYLIQKAEQAAGRYTRLDRYYRGEYPLLYPRPKADEVRVAVNYAKYVVDIALGYYLGEPVKYDSNPVRGREPLPGLEATPELEGKRNRIDLTPLLDCYDLQHVSETDLEIGRTLGVMGECLELCYASSDQMPRPKSARIDPRNGILVCDATVEHNKLFALVWEKRESTDRQQYYAATLYTDRTEKDYRSDSLKNAVFHQVGETREHFFGGVPVIAYTNNEERQGDFEQITSLIDAYNQLMSSRLTDKKKFVDALLVKNKIRRMERGLKERFALYNRWLVTMGEMKRVGVNDVDVVFTVNMPINEAETVELVTQLQGIVDDQTLLSQLWFVWDPAEAAENIRRQRREDGQGGQEQEVSQHDEE